MRKLCKNTIFVMALVLLCAAVILSPAVAHALLSPSYVQTVQEEGLEWWSDVLALSEVKDTVDGWFSRADGRYDFEDISPIVVAVIDSGVDVGHEAFSGTYDQGESDVLLRDDDGNLICANTVVGSRGVMSDVSRNGHGTHVAGIVATLIHMMGLEKYIKIMPIAAGIASSDGGASFNLNDLIEGIEFALENGADVVNLSLESASADYDIVSDAWASQAVFVAAAGNGRKTLNGNSGYDSAVRKCYPAASENVIGVMNVSDELDEDGNLKLSDASNYGDAYDLCAPGALIYSANGKEDDYVAKSGTSMAAPIASFASALALLRARADKNATEETQSAEYIKKLVEFSSTSCMRKGGYRLNMLDMKKLAESDGMACARADVVYGEDRQRLDELSEIVFRLDAFPTDMYGQGKVEWTLGDPVGEKIGEGFEFSFTPPREVGKKTIYARWTLPDGSVTVASYEVILSYAELSKERLDTLEIGVLADGGEILTNVKFEKGKEYTLAFAGAKEYSPEALKEVVWYVNGERIGTGAQARFTPSGDGKYEIYVSFDDMLSAKSVVEFKENRTIAYVCYTIVAAGVLVIVVIGMIRACASFRAKKRK